MGQPPQFPWGFCAFFHGDEQTCVCAVLHKWYKGALLLPQSLYLFALYFPYFALPFTLHSLHIAPSSCTPFTLYSPSSRPCTIYICTSGVQMGGAPQVLSLRMK